jgi:hypothetical protein
MTKSLSSLWLKSVRRMGRAQLAQGRRQRAGTMPDTAPTAWESGRCY